MEPSYDVFISYSSKDYKDEKGCIIPNNVISMIRKTFDDNGISYWIDEREIMTGEILTKVIAGKIRMSKVFIFICSKNAAESEWVSREIRIAEEHKKKIIPFVCDKSYKEDIFIAYTAGIGRILYNKYPQLASKQLLESIKELLPTIDLYLGLQKIKQDDHWGFVNAKGEIVVPCKYNDVTYFQEGLACVESDKRKWGFVDEKGNEVIPCKWEDVGFFSEGLAYVEDANWQKGFIDKTGKIVIPCQWEDAMPFSHGFTNVKSSDGKWKKINKAGKLL